MASPDSAPAPVDNVTDLGQARRARSARQPAKAAAAAPDGAAVADETNQESPGSSVEKTSEPVAKAKPARRKPGNRRFDREKVDRLKAQIADGSYEIDPVRVADKFIEHERN